MYGVFLRPPPAGGPGRRSCSVDLGGRRVQEAGKRPRTRTMKVLLSTPPGKTTELWPPLGLLYLASSIKAKRGVEVKVIDAFCENLSGAELSRRVLEGKPDVFGINCSTHTFLDAIALMQELKTLRPEMKLILGGYHATFAAERILKEYPF